MFCVDVVETEQSSMAQTGKLTRAGGPVNDMAGSVELAAAAIPGYPLGVNAIETTMDMVKISNAIDSSVRCLFLIATRN